MNATLCLPRPSSSLDPHKPVIVVSEKPAKLEPNHVLLKVDRFGFSANNVTYQALGEHPHFRYFDFHSAPTSTQDSVSPKSHGVVPTWGFATVEASTHPKIQPGERVYGYLAPTRYLLLPVSATDVNKYAFYVPRPHLPADRRPYNQILRCASDPQYSPLPAVEDLTMLYRPLFWTSYWFEDHVFASLPNYSSGIANLIISSASSKTAFCLAYLAQKRYSALANKIRVVGLTSPSNLEFTKSLGLYDLVLPYASFTDHESLWDPSQKWLYVDVSANDALNSRVFWHFGSPYTGELEACYSLGMSSVNVSGPSGSVDWSSNTLSSPNIPASSASSSNTEVAFWPRLSPFFMPEWLAIRARQLSLATIFERQKAAWDDLMRDCVGWVKIERQFGESSVKTAYEDMVKGKVGPDRGCIWSLWDEEGEIKGITAKL